MSSYFRGSTPILSATSRSQAICSYTHSWSCTDDGMHGTPSRSRSFALKE